MPYQFDYDAENKILRVRYIGQISDDLVKECYQVAPQFVTRTNPRSVIIDLSEVTSFDVSPQTMHELANLKPTVKDPSVPRIVVAPTPYIYGMSRIFQIVGSRTRPALHLVKSFEEAYIELGVTRPKFGPLPESSGSGS